MPFHLPEYDYAFTKFVHEALDQLARARSPVLRQIPVESVAGTASSVVDARGADQLDLPAEPVEVGFTIDVAAVRKGDSEALTATLSEASDELGKQMVGLLVKTVNKVTEATGNVVRTEGDFRFEHFYQALDRLEWSLDDAGELVLPQLVMHPDAVKKLPVLTPDQEAALDDLKRRKKEELLARRRSRRLS